MLIHVHHELFGEFEYVFCIKSVPSLKTHVRSITNSSYVYPVNVEDGILE